MMALSLGSSSSSSSSLLSLAKMKYMEEAEGLSRSSSSSSRSAPLSLPLLQNNIKRDPEAYEGEFQLQFTQFQALAVALQQQPQRQAKDLQQLLMFLAHTAPYYSPLRYGKDARGAAAVASNSKKRKKRAVCSAFTASAAAAAAASEAADLAAAAATAESDRHAFALPAFLSFAAESAASAAAAAASTLPSLSLAADMSSSTINRDYSEELVRTVLQLLTNFSSTLHPMMRQALLTSLLLLRRRQQLSCVQMLQVSVHLLQLKDKSSRETLFSFVPRDVARVCAADHLQHSFPRVVGPLLFRLLLKPPSPLAARLALTTLISIYREAQQPVVQSSHRGKRKRKGGAAAGRAAGAGVSVKNLQKLVNAVASCTLAPDLRLAASAALFLLGEIREATTRLAQGGAEDEGHEEEEDAAAVAAAVAAEEAKHLLQKKRGLTKKSAAAKRKLKQAQKRLGRKQQRVEQHQQQGAVLASATIIDYIYDPHALAEKIFSRVRQQSSGNFSARLVLLNLLSRLIGHHKLLLLNFYPFLQKYLLPQQRVISSLLAYAATAAHEMIPPLELRPIVKHIADVFVNETRSEEVISLGLNAITEICSRAPLCMTPELLEDLVEYRKEKKKGKSTQLAARRLMNLYRDVMPQLLPAAARGKEAALALQQEQVAELEFGKFAPAADVAGAEELERLRKLVAARSRHQQQQQQNAVDFSDEEEEDDEEEEEGEEEEEEGEEGEEDDEEEGEEEEEEEEEDDEEEEGEEEENAKEEEEEGGDEERQRKRRKIDGAAQPAATGGRGEEEEKKGEKVEEEEKEGKEKAGEGQETTATSGENRSAGAERIFTREEFLALRLLRARAAGVGSRQQWKQQKGKRLRTAAADEEEEEDESERLLLSLVKKAAASEKEGCVQQQRAATAKEEGEVDKEKPTGRQRPHDKEEARGSGSEPDSEDEETDSIASGVLSDSSGDEDAVEHGFVSHVTIEGLAGKKRRQRQERNRLREEAKTAKLLKKKLAAAGKGGGIAAASQRKKKSLGAFHSEAKKKSLFKKKKESSASGNAPQHVKARSKPIAMVRQSRKLRTKKQQSAADKVRNLKRHIKNLKKSQVGRPRRRKR